MKQLIPALCTLSLCMPVFAISEYPKISLDNGLIQVAIYLSDAAQG